MTAQDKLKSRIGNGLHICVGLDSDIKKIPKHLLSYDDPVLEFNRLLIENTYKEVCAYKINTAFYESSGIDGLRTMEETIKIIPNDILIIGDAKRGDIGNTSRKYAQSIYDCFKFDSTTLHPYMGYDSISPFLEYKDKINFILALTSNPGSNDFEKLQSDNKYIYEHVIKKCSEWNTNKNIGIVFGATNPDELKNAIDDFGNLFVLLPGVGAQGGDLEKIVSTFEKKKNINYIINVSRAIIYSDSEEEFHLHAKNKLIEYNEQIFNILKRYY
ncbi:MAG: orotidine-5'-phosphate decarboxylase [Melioribacteraceae bacterium]|nr:orotidine-5'-phosphate decarboxylase [Melioribacteraceae bacterium]MCF8355533.1 orotidine-5'-phosphate decarboxylase [Melioribacteraceae bacterium]MCF8394512.1 orotidine-5'-phosphate decarboxylase [Melioribacteraceae bacterium]MCF8420128.1 orotidine-5'-phosphate decarboxylase [Melioribacteraceae bacterium]